MTTVQRRIDAHQHFWDPARGDYPWMTDGGPLDRTFLPSDLAPLSAAAGIDGTIAVQAAPTVAETRWLIERAADSDVPVAGVVGWVDLAADDVARQLDEIDDVLLVGIRPMIQDLDPDWIRQPSVARGLRELADRDLAFELLALPKHLGPAADVLAPIDGLRVIVDHLAKPDYRAWSDDWAHHIGRLAAREQTWIKISGLATEVEPPVVAATFVRHVTFVLDRFGADRSMLGTDWPVSTLALDHAASVELLDTLVAGCSDSERLALWGDSCANAYALDSTGNASS